MLSSQTSPPAMTEEAIVSRLVDKAISSISRGFIKLFDITDAIKTEAEAIISEGLADPYFVNDIVMSSKPFVASLLSGGVTEEEIIRQVHEIFPGKENILLLMKQNPNYAKYFELNLFINICNKSLNQQQLPPSPLMKSPPQQPQPQQLQPQPPPQQQQQQPLNYSLNTVTHSPSPQTPTQRTICNYEDEKTFIGFIKKGETVCMRKLVYFNGSNEFPGYELFNGSKPDLRYPVFLHADFVPGAFYDTITVRISRVERFMSKQPLNRYCIIKGNYFYIISGNAEKYN